MRAALLFLASLLASAKAVGRSQKATKQAMNVDEDDEPDICADEEAPMTETMLSTCVTPAASHDGVPYCQDANAAKVNSFLGEMDVECTLDHADGKLGGWLIAHERGERNSHHHMNGVIVVRSTGSDADKIKYARNLLRTCFLRVAEGQSFRITIKAVAKKDEQYTMGYCFKDHTLPHFESTHGGISMQQIKQNYLIYLGKCTQNSFAGGKKATKNPLTDKKEIDIKSGAMVPVAMAFVAEHGLAGLVRANVLDLPLVLALMLLSGCWRLDESLAVGRNGGNPVSAERLQALLVLALIDYSTTLAVVYAAVTTVLSGQPAAPSATNGVVAGTGAAAFALPSTADIVSGNYGMDGVKATAMRQKVAENHAAPVAPVDAQFRMDAHALGRGSAQVPKRRAAGSAPLPSPLRQCTADGAPVNRALHAEFEVAAGELDIRYLVVDFSSSMQAQTTVAMFVGDGGLGSSCLRTDQLLDACGYVATAAAVAADDAGPDLFSTLECPDVDAGNEGTFIEEANIILDILDDNGNVEEDAVWLFDRQMIELAGQLDGHPIPEPAWLAPPMPMAAFRNFYARTLIVPSEHDRLHIAIVNTIEGASASVSSQQSSAGQHWFMAAWLVSRRDDASPHAAATTSQPMAAAAAASNVDADSDTDPSDGVESEPEYEEEMTEVCPDLNTLGSRM